MVKFMNTEGRCLRCGGKIREIKIDTKTNERIKFCSDYCKKRWNKQ